MIEILLRQDINDYKPKPFFGLTTRQIATGAVAAVLALGEGYLLYALLGVPVDLGGLVIVATCLAVFLLGLGERDGVSYLRLARPMFEYWWAPPIVEHASPELTVRWNRDEREPSKAESREERRELKLAKRDSEFCGADGECTTAKAARRERGIAVQGKNRKHGKR